MSLETDIARLADVLEKGFAALTAAIARQSEIASPTLAEPVSPPAPAPAKRAKSPPPVVEPASSPAPEAIIVAPNGQARGPTFDEVVAIAQELARQKTPPVAIKLINQHGAQKLADMDPAQYPAFYAAAQVELGQTSL